MNGDALWKYLNAMSVSMGAPAAGKVSEVGSQARPISFVLWLFSVTPSLPGRTLLLRLTLLSSQIVTGEQRLALNPDVAPSTWGEASQPPRAG